MKEMFDRWWNGEAHPLEFWKPRSGISGGAIAGGLVCGLLKVFGVF